VRRLKAHSKLCCQLHRGGVIPSVSCARPHFQMKHRLCGEQEGINDNTSKVWRKSGNTSDAKEPRGDRVPDARITERTESDTERKATAGFRLHRHS
jgi:hypothetical protein